MTDEHAERTAGDVEGGSDGDGEGVDTLSFELSDRFLQAADEWGDSRVMDRSAAVEEKVEQALLEVEHLLSGAVEVEFEVEDDGAVVTFEPSDELGAFLARQARETGLDPDQVLKLHADLFARVFLDDDQQTAETPPEI
ncbi:hypothetical protein [Natrinema salifodinae]|uniref:Uncharacterized protein n=1 Tax=Natrinema salifodinae TaxID=1202768 RepID=A0A1I0PKQ4_9EURY|nr:hypothetical protein [Natrinema salifodinae]SEW14825.1 hypothetical protein SAMN05216285_2663 [Natrinema salifodinae]